MRITVDEAREYFAHPSQLPFGLTPDDLPESFVYYADRGVCMAFHGVLWPGIVAVHVGTHPGRWGRTTEPCRAMLVEFQRDFSPLSIVAAIERKNRHAVALARRVGGVDAGELSPEVILMKWVM